MKNFKIKFYLPVLLLFSWPAFAQELEIMGKVVDKATKNAVAGATVVVYPSGEKTQTKENGNFFLTVEQSSGMFLQILKPGYNSLKIASGFEEVYAEMELSTQVEGQKVVVKGKRDEKRVVVSRQQVDRKEIQRTTTSVFADAVKVVQTLPGVVTTSEFSALMYVRGGSAYEIMNYYDRILLFNAYVWGGMMSVYNPDVVQSIDFYSGAFPAEYGNAMSGVMDVRMRDGKTDQFGGIFDLSVATFTGMFEGPIGKPGETQDSFLIAVRRTHYDLAAKLLAETGAISDKYSGVQFPFFYDAHIRFKFQLNEANILKIYSLLVYEGMDVSFDDVASSDESSDGWKEGNEFHYKDFRYLQGLTLTSAFSKSFVMENTLGYDYSQGDFKYVDVSNPVNVKYQGHYFTYRNDTTLKPNDHHTVKLGLGAYLYLYDMDSHMIVSSLPEGTVGTLDAIIPSGYTQSGGSYYMTQANYDTLVAAYKKEWSFDYSQKTYFLPTVYLQDDIEILDEALFLNLGVRADYFNISGNYTVDPRAGLKMVFKDIFTLKLAGGVYSQQISQGIYYDSTFGNPDLKPSKSYHGVVSFEKELPDYFFRFDLFYKHYTDLVNSDSVKHYVNGTSGRSYGFELFAQKKLSGSWDGWLSYTYVLTERKVDERSSDVSNNPDFEGGSQGESAVGQWYYPEYDRRHSLNLVLNYTLAPKWEIATTVKVGSGLPYTPLAGKNDVVVTSDGTSGGTVQKTDAIPVWGDYNSARLPLYFNMDIKVSMPFFWEKWSSYVQIMNLTGLFGNKKVEGYYYDETYSQKREVTGMPFLIIAGIKAEF